MNEEGEEDGEQRHDLHPMKGIQYTEESYKFCCEGDDTNFFDRNEILNNGISCSGTGGQLYGENL